MAGVVRVGVGVIVRSLAHPGCVLIGKRINSHGHGKLALPGGHLEMNETYQECARREVKEETNLDIENVEFVHVTQDMCIDGDPNKHYITIFVTGLVCADSDDLQNMEPHKCEWLEYADWASTVEMYRKNPDSLFDPLKNFIREGNFTFLGLV